MIHYRDYGILGSNPSSVNESHLNQTFLGGWLKSSAEPRLMTLTIQTPTPSRPKPQILGP